MEGSAFEEKSCVKMLRLNFSSKLDWGLLHIISIAKTASKEIGALICFIIFFLLMLLCISISSAWNTVVMFWQVLVIVTWNCLISYKNWCAGLFRVQQLVYLCKPTLDMLTLTHMLIFFLWFFKVFKIFLVLIILYC